MKGSMVWKTVLLKEKRVGGQVRKISEAVRMLWLCMPTFRASQARKLAYNIP